MTPFRERLKFDAEAGEYRDGAIRYMMIRPDALMGMIAELPEALQPEVFAAFARSIRRHGGHSAREYQRGGAATAEHLLRVIEETAPQLGWGRWTLTHGGDTITLAVRNSPFAAGAGASRSPVCTPIRGMLSALAELVFGEEATVAETTCAACGADACTFIAKKSR